MSIESGLARSDFGTQWRLERLDRALNTRKLLENGGLPEEHPFAEAPYEEAQPILDQGIVHLVADVLILKDDHACQAMRQMVESLHRYFEELGAPVELPEWELPY